MFTNTMVQTMSKEVKKWHTVCPAENTVWYDLFSLPSIFQDGNIQTVVLANASNFSFLTANFLLLLLYKKLYKNAPLKKSNLRPIYFRGQTILL